MIIGVPIFAVLYSAIKRIANYKLNKRKLPTDTSMYLNVESIDSDSKFIKHNMESEEISGFVDVKKQYYKLDMKHAQDNQENKDKIEE